MELMNEKQVEYADLKAVAVSAGPGSYTGLRIGTSTAKGICYALSIPLISIPTLDLIAIEIAKVATEDKYLIPMIDARRMEVYTQVLDNQANVVLAPTAMIIDENAFSEILASNETIAIGGNGSPKCKDIFKDKVKYVENCFPLAKNMCKLAEKKFSQKQFEDVAYYEPFYLKEFQAITPKNKVLKV